MSTPRMLRTTSRDATRVRGGAARGPRTAPPPPYQDHVARAEDEATLRLQLNALQAMSRQVFGFRLAMIALGTPFALHRTADGPATWLIGSAVLITFMGSYVMFRDWERFGPLFLKHPALLALDMLFGALLLITATPDSTLAYVTVCTPLLAGLAYSWRGAGVFTGLQILLLTAAYGANPGEGRGLAATLVLPGFCVVAGAFGVTLRNLLLRFGTAGRALTETRARLAAAEAVGDERARLARDMHDSVAKTLHGLALAADGLAHSADGLDPQTVQRRAELIAHAARHAAAESRELLSDLRRGAETGKEGPYTPDSAPVPIVEELAERTAEWARRTGIPCDVHRQGEAPAPPLPYDTSAQLLTIVSEALENAQRHARASRVTVEVETGAPDAALRVSVLDDGAGLPPGTCLEDLCRTGHFGLVGMVERAARVGARIRIGRGSRTTGTEVRLELPRTPGPPALRLPPPRAPLHSYDSNRDALPERRPHSAGRQLATRGSGT